MPVRTAATALTSMVARIRGRSLDELRVRGIQALYASLERFGGLFTALGPPASVRTRTNGRFDADFALLAGGGADPEAVARAIAQRDPDIRARLEQRSDAAERGVVALLGYERQWVGNPPRWHREPLSGTQAPMTHWSRINHLDSAVVGDHKLLWELNRHQYLLAPAFCWLLDREARRFELIQAHLESWLDDNPARQGINWVSSLEAAYRAITWCWLLSMLRDAPWRPDLKVRLLAMLEAHARHVERYLSTYFSPNTHLTGEALGLFYVGTVLRESRHTRRWRVKGAAILETEIGRQVHADGVYFEQASQYHRYTAEIYLHYLLLANASGWPVSDTVRDALANLFAVLRSLASAAGHMPLVGDDDGGMLLPFDHRSPDDVRALLLAGAVALQRPELAPTEASPSFAAWLCGLAKTELARTAPASVPDWLDMYFARGGLAILRDGWDDRTAVGVIDAGPHGALSCGHGHADALAMTLSLGATELFVDRGTLTYAGPERNEFRATVSHNTLEIDATSSVIPGEPFKWLSGIPSRAQGVVCSGAHFSSFLGLAIGHVPGGRLSAHCRAVLHQRGGAWVIHDRGMRTAARGGILRWQLAPHLTATVLTERSVMICDGTGGGVATILLYGAAPVRIVTRDMSPCFGQRVPARCLELPLDAALEALTIVVPAGSDGSVANFEVDTQDAVRTVSWSDAAGRHRVASGLGQALQLPAGAELNAGLVWRVGSVDAAGEDVHGALIAALPMAVLHVPGDAKAVPHIEEPSGTMVALVNTRGRWEQLGVQKPRRG